MNPPRRRPGAAAAPGDPRWTRCARCRHYRLEHTGRLGARRGCDAVEADVTDATASDRCDCPGWIEPPTLSTPPPPSPRGTPPP